MRLKTGHYGTQSHLVVPNVHLLLPKTMETVFEGAFPFDQPLIFEIPHCDRSHYIFSEQVDATGLFRIWIWICICGHYAKVYSQSQCTAFLMSLFSVLCVVSSACESAENAGRRLAVKLAAHPFSPRTRLLGATSRGLLRPLRGSTFGLGQPDRLRRQAHRARALGFACASPLRFATAHFSAITRLPSGASPSRLHRHLPAVRLVSRHFPPLHVALCRFNSSAAPISRFVFAVRCVILAPMHAIWFRAEYRPSPSGAPWRSLPHPAKSESLNLLSLFVSLCRAIRRGSPVASCGAFAP